MITISLLITAYYFLHKKYPHIMNKNLLTTIGFFLFMLGAVSILISMVGLQISFLKWADDIDRTIGLFIKLTILVFGALLAFFSKIDLSKEEDEYTLQGRK
jgi:hypothetical protein